MPTVAPPAVPLLEDMVFLMQVQDMSPIHRAIALHPGLLNTPDGMGRLALGALMWADITPNHEAVLREVLAAGANPNLVGKMTGTDPDLRYPLHQATLKRDLPSYAAALLLDYDANPLLLCKVPDSKYPVAVSALSAAVIARRPDLVELILEKGPPLSAYAAEPVPPLYHAVSKPGLHSTHRTLDILCAAGADWDAPCGYTGQSAAAMASNAVDLRHYLLNKNLPKISTSSALPRL